MPCCCSAFQQQQQHYYIHKQTNERACIARTLPTTTAPAMCIYARKQSNEKYKTMSTHAL